VCAAIGGLARASVNALHSPCLTTVCDSCADTCQSNANTHHQNASASLEFDSILPTVNVPHSLPVSVGVASAARQLHLNALSSVKDDQSVDQQYPLSDLSSVLNNETLIGPQTPCADAAHLTQYPLCDSFSDVSASLHVGEPASLLQFPLDDSPESIAAALHRETDNFAITVDRVEPVTHCQLQEPTVQHDGKLVHQLSVHHSSLSESTDDVNTADRHDSDFLTSSNTSVNSRGSRLQVNKDISDTNFQNIFVSYSLSPASNDESVDVVSKTAKSVIQCLASDTIPSMLPRVRQSDHTDTSVDRHASSPVDPQLGSVAATYSKTVPALDIITDLHHVSSSASAVLLPAADCIVQPTDSKLPVSGPASPSASVELGCVGPVDAINHASKMSGMSAVSDTVQLTDSELPSSITCDTVIRQLVGMSDDKEPTDSQTGLVLLDMSASDIAKSLRNAADGSEASDVLLPAVQTSVNVGPTVVTNSGSVNHDAHGGIVTGSAEHSDMVVQDQTVCDNHTNDFVIITEVLANIVSQAQYLAVSAEKSSDMSQSDSVLVHDEDTGSESDDDDLGDSVKRILAKYRVRRGPVGSDSMQACSSAKVGNVLMLDADDFLLNVAQREDTSTARDTDTYSDSSDDTLASRVKALLLKEQQVSGREILSTVMTQKTSDVMSLSSSRSTPVDYSNLSRELNEIQMQLDSLRNREKNSVGSSSSSVCMRSPVTDVSEMQESLSVFVQQKTDVDQLLQCSMVGHAGDGLHVDHCGSVSKADTATAVPLALVNAELDKAHWDFTTSPNRQSTADVTSVQNLVEPLMSPSNSTSCSVTSVPGTKFAHSYTLLPDYKQRRSRESSTDRSELVNTADEVQNTMSSTGSKQLLYTDVRRLPVKQTVNYTDGTRGVQDSSTMDDAGSEVSSLQTDVLQSESSIHPQVDEWRLARGSAVEAASQQSSTDMIQASTDGNSSAHDYFAELLKHSSVAAAANQQMLVLTDDECCQSDVLLSDRHTMKSIHPPPAAQLDKGTMARFDQGTTLLSTGASNDSLVAQALDRNVQQTENFNSQLRTDAVVSPYMRKSYLFDSDMQKVTCNAQFVSSAGLEFTPLAELPHGRESSASGSYDGDNEQLFSDLQSYNDVGEVKVCSEDVEQQLATDATDSSCDVDVSVSCLRATRSVQTVGSHSPGSGTVLQPYQ